jgi:DNA-binding transcriptional MerR regulator
MPFTVGELVERIAKRGQSKAALNERIRHWTRERLLSPIGKRNPGTGRHRTYHDTALLDAALLNELADMGLQIGTMRKALAAAQQLHTEWGKAKAKQGKRCFLAIYFPTDIPPHLHFGDGNPLDTDFESLITFDLTRLFARLKTEGE